jgi:hypothetical protein
MRKRTKEENAFRCFDNIYYCPPNNKTTNMVDDNNMTVFLTVTANQGARVPLEFSTVASPTILRQKASEATNIPLQSLRLIYRGRMIKDDATKGVIDEYNLEKDCVLHCMGKPETASLSSAAVPASTTPPTPANTTTTAGSSVSIPSATAAASSVASAPLSGDPLHVAIHTLRSSNAPSVFLTAVSTLGKILDNITANPMEEKYRSLKKGNAAFQKRLGGLVGGDAAMKGAGFVIEIRDGEESYVIQASAEAWPKLMAAKTAMEQAVKDAKAATTQGAAPISAGFGGAAPPNMMGGGGGMPGMPGMPAGGMNPAMQNAMADMMSNPEALRNMMQVSYIRLHLFTSLFVCIQKSMSCLIHICSPPLAS